MGDTYSYSVTLGGVAYSVQAGDLVDGKTVVGTWTSILEALEFKLESSGLVTVAADPGAHALTITAVADNSTFVLGAVDVVQHLDTAVSNAFVDDGQIATTAPGTVAKQVSEVRYKFENLATGTDYTVVINDHVYSVQTGENGILSLKNTGAGAISVNVNSPITGASASAVSVAGADATVDRTINLSGTAVVIGGTYTITVAGVAFSHVAVTGNTLDNIATALAAKIEAHASYAASASTTVVTISDGAGTATLSVSGFSPYVGADKITLTKTTEAGVTANLTGAPLVNNGQYVVTIGASQFVYVADGTATLAEIGAGLAAAVNPHATYDATYAATTVTKTWASVLTTLAARIEAGEAITVNADATNVALSKMVLTAVANNTAFSIDAVAASLVASVTIDGTEPLVAAASGVAQQNLIDFGAVTFQEGRSVVVLVNGVQHSALTVSKVVAGNGTTTYPVRTWTQVLTELKTSIELDGKITVTIDATNQALTLLAKTANVAFSVDAAFISTKADVLGAPNTPTTRAGVSQAQVNTIDYAALTILDGHAFDVSVNGNLYSVTAGKNGVTASWSRK